MSVDKTQSTDIQQMPYFIILLLIFSLILTVNIIFNVKVLWKSPVTEFLWYIIEFQFLFYRELYLKENLPSFVFINCAKLCLHIFNLLPCPLLYCWPEYNQLYFINNLNLLENLRSSLQNSSFEILWSPSVSITLNAWKEVITKLIISHKHFFGGVAISLSVIWNMSCLISF